MESLGPSGRDDARIFLVDDEPLVRHGLQMLIALRPHLSVCGEAEDAGEALEKITALHPDVAVIDLGLKTGDGMKLIRRLRRQMPTLRILVFSLHDESAVVEKAFRTGASGYVSKEEGADLVVTAIRELLAGRRYVSEKLAARLSTSPRRTGLSS